MKKKTQLKNTTRALKIENFSMDSMNVSFVLAVPVLVLLIGGILIDIWVPLFYNRPTDGSLTPEMNTEMKDLNN